VALLVRERLHSYRGREVKTLGEARGCPLTAA
jgi:hypothetical protein